MPVTRSELRRPRWPTHVPDDDFTTFRAACRDVLTGEEFAVVDAAFLGNVVVLRNAVAGMVPVATSAKRRPRRCSPTTGRPPSRWRTTYLVRAASAAFCLAGHYLQVDLDQLIGAAARMQRRALRSAATWARLHAYPEPHRGAICALAAAGLAVEEMRHLAVGSYDASMARWPPAMGAKSRWNRPLASSWWHNSTCAPARGQRLLTRCSQTRDGAPMSASAMVTVIHNARRELGVAVAPARQDRKPIFGDRWMTRWGVSVQELL